MTAMHFRNTFPALAGETVTQGHADACAEHGHATHKIDGVIQPRCPRCGELTEETTVSNHFAIRHTFPNGGTVSDGYIHSGTFSQEIKRYYSYSEASESAETMRDYNPGHAFVVVPFPNKY